MKMLFGLVASLLTAVALAQNAAPPAKNTTSAETANTGDGLTEVVVTARRREESAQTVPVTITVLSATDLAERHITTGQDLQGQIPSLAVSAYSQVRDTENFTVRGQGTTYGASPAVVEYLAEVPLIIGRVATLQGSPGQFLDLANIQVLSGPQGTLFGRNSTGGALLLEPAKPTNEATGYVQLQGGNYADREVEAVTNVPLSDTLMIRFAGRFVDRDGFTKDVVTGTDYDNRHYLSGRLGVLWKPTDGVENYLMFDASNSSSNGAGWVVQQFNVPLINGVFGSFGGCAGVGLGPNCSVLTSLANAQNARGIRDVSLGPTPLDTHVRSWTAIDQLSVKLSDSVTIRNIMSYGQLQGITPYDGDGTPLGFYNANLSHDGGWTDDYSQFTEEVQLQGNALESNLQYTTGVYYEKIRSPSSFTVADAIDFLQPSANAGILETDAKAIYAQGTFDFGALAKTFSGLRLTGGLRYTWDEAQGTGSSIFYAPDGQTIVACSNGVSAVASSLADCAVSSKTSSSSPSWTVGLDYRMKDVMPYAKVTYGYKAGGINLYAVNLSHTTFTPEYVTTYEAGFKSTFKVGEVPVLFNADAFYTQYKDIQVAAGDYNADTGGNGAAVFNAASARIQGVEVEAMVKPFRGLELSANYSHLNGEYKNYTIQNAFGQIDCSGGFVVGTVNLACLPFPNIPDNQYSITGRYALPVPAHLGTIVLSATYAFTGKQWEGTTALPVYDPGSYFDSFGLLNLSANWNDIFKTPLDVGFFATNATNTVYRNTYTGVFQTLGVESSLYGEPRMYGVQLRYHW